MRTYYCSLLFYYVKINFVSKDQKNHCIWKVLFTSKNSDQACDYMLQESLYSLFVKLILFLYVIWIRFENHYVLEFKYILYMFWFLKPLSLTMFWAPPMGIYVGTETSFIMGFATDLCVVFGPCHKDNVAVVTKTV